LRLDVVVSPPAAASNSMNVVFVDFAAQNQQKPRSLTFPLAAGAAKGNVYGVVQKASGTSFGGSRRQRIFF